MSGEWRVASGEVRHYRDLLVWQKSMSLAERCYQSTLRFDAIHQWSLGHQLRKSCVSVPSNIAEGFGRHHTPEYVHHLRFSNGSNNELQTQMELARRLGALNNDAAQVLIIDSEEIGRMLHGLINSLERGRGPVD